MWKQLQAVLSPPEPQQLSVESYGQDACGLPIEQVAEVMGWAVVSWPLTTKLERM